MPLLEHRLGGLPLSIRPGAGLGRYEIRAKIGEGGMGEVYLAQDTKLERTVALKILPANVAADRQRMQRFIQEAKAASGLNHPNILTIHEIEQIDSTHFMATEFIDGETLRQHLNAGRVKIAEALDISVQIASALSAAHAAGIIHRDIKPENIMRRRDGIVKVLDFGLAKLSERTDTGAVDTEAATKALVQTEPGVVMGTAAYMSPEQARGLVVDTRTDIFSLGVVIYEMVAGQAPFGGATRSDLIVALLERDPPPLAHFTPEAPAELERLVMKTLAKDREERYQTAKDLLIDLKRLKQKLGVDAEIERSAPPELRVGESRPPDGREVVSTAPGVAAQTEVAGARTNSSAEYIISEIKRHKRSLTVALAVLLLAAVGFGYWFYAGRASNATQIESIAVLPFVNASGNSDVEYLSDGMTESLINSLSQLPHLSVKARSSVFRYKGQEVESQRVASELSVQAILTGRVVQRGDDLTLYLSLVDGRNGNQLWGEQYSRKLADLVALQQEIARDVSQKLRMRLSGADAQKLTKNYTQNAEAYQAYLKGLYYWHKGLAPGYEKSRDYFQQAIDVDPSYALAYSGLADYYGFASASGLLPPNENWPKAEAAANKALALDETLAESYNPLAAVKLYYYRDWPAAERYFRRGIELDPNYTEIHIHYANCLYLFGRNEEALTEIQRAAQLEPLSPRPNLNWARILFFIRQYDRAIDQFGKTLELEPNFAPAHEWLGYAYEQNGMHREAIAAWAKALTLSGEGEQASILERAYAASGFETAVRALAQKKLERLNEKTGRGEYVPAAEYVMAYLRLGDKEKGFEWLAKAVEENYRFALDLKVNPIFDSLRSDPRFADLVRRVGL